MLTRFLRSQFRSPLHHFRPSFPFCTLPNIDFTEYTRIYRHQVTPEEIEFTVNTGSGRIDFALPESATLGELKNKLKEYSQDIETVQAYSMDLAELADLTKIADLGNETHYLVMNKTNLIKVRSRDRGEAEVSDYEYRKREESSMQSGLPFIEQQIILNYLKRVDILNKAELGKNLFADNHLYEGKIDKKLIIKNLLDGIICEKNHPVDERDMMSHYYQLRQRVEALDARKEILEKKVQNAVKIKMGIGLLALFSQFAFVGVGTYVYYSWDIMEPVAYFISLMGSIAISTLYFKLHSDYSNVGYLKHMKEKELDKLLKKEGFSLEELKRMKDEIEVMEKKIKTNILIDL